MKILLVDDDLSVLKSLKDLLIEKKYIVDVATTCYDAFSMHAENKYDVLIIDIDFGDGINGIEAAKIIRQEDKKITIIVITAFNYIQGSRQEVLALGGHFLEKPIEMSTLVNIIEKKVL